MSHFESRPAGAFDFQDILYEKKDWVARITIDRPHAYNAYSTPALRELAMAFQDAAFDDSVAAVVYTGSGTDAFCTGGDVKEYERLYTDRPRDYWKYMQLFRAYLESILRCGKPVIARLNGMAVGGGNESQMACDLALIAEHAWIGQVGTRVGSVAAGGATQWLPILVGDRRAREILYLNERIAPQKALDWGLVNRVVPSVVRDGAFVNGATQEEIEKARRGEDGYGLSLEALDRAVDEVVDKLLDKFAECTRFTKLQVNVWKEMAWNQTIGAAGDWLSVHYTGFEPWEGMRAFVEKRAPRYRHLRELAAAGGSSEFVWGPYRQGCSACGAEGIPTGFSFCGACGAPLDEAHANGGPAAGTAHAGAHPAGGASEGGS
ncbi:MAG: enoyl-CoA hydratase-related protein [Candidatus Palauibacterales bacterium]|nr:enoyl-CoA hydratase-related protein [Candidatus Palauibacterales bacterium]MDP2528522.1 enoyl-CoA hydratase-related protein [Candidatus Palauibacterales bacterium]MDP2583696.1 enoyl-CoA hydratase-related protein [Candidatus Palauibacterales bacterium]